MDTWLTDFGLSKSIGPDQVITYDCEMCILATDPLLEDGA